MANTRNIWAPEQLTAEPEQIDWVANVLIPELRSKTRTADVHLISQIGADEGLIGLQVDGRPVVIKIEPLG